MNRKVLSSVRSPLWPVAIALMTLVSPPAGAAWNHSQMFPGSLVEATGSLQVFQRQYDPNLPATTHILYRSFSWQNIFTTADCFYSNGSGWAKYPTDYYRPKDVTGGLVVNTPATAVFYVNGRGRVSRYYWYNGRFKTAELNNSAPQNARWGQTPVIDVAGNHVFYHALDNTIWMYERQDNSWDCRPMTTPQAPVAGNLVYNARGNCVYYRGVDQRVYVNWWNDTSWRCDWLTGAPGNAAGDLVVNEASTEVFYRSNGSRICSYYWDGEARVWQGPNPLNPSAPNDVAGDLVLAPGGNAIFYRNTSGLVCLYWRDGITWHCAPLNPYAPQNVRGSLVYEPATHKIFYLSDDHNKIWNYWHDIVWYAAPLNPQAPSPSPKQRVVYSDTPDAPASVFYVGIGEGVSGPPYYGPIHRLYWQGAEGLPPNGEVQGMADLDADFVPLPNGWSEGTAGGSVAGEAGRDNSFGLTNPVGLAGTDCRIMYEVPNGPARVGLQLYDVQGRLVRTLVDGEERQGPQVVTWDGKREDGSRAPKGILLIRLEVNGETRTGKLPVVK